MKFFIIIALFFYFLPSCTTHSNHSNTDLILSERDSLVWMNELIDSLEDEIKSRTNLEIQHRLTNLNLCYLGNQLFIKVTKKDLILINNVFSSSVSSDVYDFYIRNFYTVSDRYEYVDYFFLNREEIEESIKNIHTDIQELEAEKSQISLKNTERVTIDDFIKVKREVLKKYQLLRDVLLFSGKNKIHLSNSSNEVHVSYPNDYLFKTELKDSILHGFFQIRNEFTTFYFKKTYLQLFAENRTLKSKENQTQLDALKLIYPFLLFSPEMPGHTGPIEVPVP